VLDNIAILALLGAICWLFGFAKGLILAVLMLATIICTLQGPQKHISQPVRAYRDQLARVLVLLLVTIVTIKYIRVFEEVSIAFVEKYLGIPVRHGLSDI